MQLYEEVSPTRVFSCGICEIFKNTYFNEHLQTTVSESCSNFTRTALFLIIYTSGSNWYICFSSCIIIYSFVWQLSLFTTIDTAIIRTSWCSAKRVLLQILQNSQESTCVKDSFLMKLQIYRVYLYQKRYSGIDVFL